MRFIHMSDNHLGFRQYGLFEREKDFYDVFDQAIEAIIEERPQFVIHSGDLFEFSRPPIRALLKVQEGLIRLKEKGITFYAIPGNHDRVMRKNTNVPQELYSKTNMKLIDYYNSYYVHENIFIGGCTFFSKYYNQILMTSLDKIRKKAEKYKKKILVLHQALDKYLPFEYEIKISELPKIFNYYAFGHIHKRILEDFGEGKLAYAGSTELWSIDEYKSYEKNGKGFYLVDIDKDFPEIQSINLELSREIMQESLSAENIDSELNKLVDKISNYNKKPIIFLKIQGKNLKANIIYQKLLKTLSNHVLTMRPDYESDEIEHIQKIAISTLDIKKIINELKGKNSDMKKLAIELFDLLSKNEIDSALETTKKVYEVFS